MISVVVTTLVRPGLIELLSSLKGQCYDELIVHLASGKGIAKDRNDAWKKSTGDIVAFVDDDLVLASDYIERVREFLSSAALNPDDLWFGHSKIMGLSPNREDMFCGGSMWFDRRILEQWGGFDERFRYFNEDVAMYFLCRKMGYKFFYFADSVAWDKGLDTMMKLKHDNAILKTEFPHEYKGLERELR